MKQALEALETCTEGDYSTGHVIHPSFDEKAVTDAITALRAAIEAQEKYEPVFEVGFGWLDTVNIYPNGTLLYTHPQPIPDGCKNDAARWNFVMATEPYALNLWNALPKNIYQQERHLNTAIDQAMLAQRRRRNHD
jgi:hypothetical protein